jgi:hypothetical protein
VNAALQGGCLCGQVRWRAEGPVLHRVHCHCTLCRRGSGALVVPWITVERRHFAWTAVPPAFYRSTAKGERGFCPACGAKLSFTHDDFADHVDLALGSLDDAEAGYPADQIHGANRVSWLALDPHLPFRLNHAPMRPIAEPPPLAATAEHGGGCLCGAVRYTATGPPIRGAFCHCGLCRKATGGVAVAWGVWRRDRWRDDGGPTRAYAATRAARRRFCPVCGATVYFEAAGGDDVVEILLGSLDDPDTVAPGAHIYAADAPSWLTFDDSRPRWPGRLNEGSPNDTLLRPAS